MAEAALELRSILDAAEQAASVQDFASAEHHLRQAAALQEQQLGASHPDLANTLNNLGIVCERTGKVSDAEACYRRAYAIARATLPAEDPLVVTSGQNLKDFCAATGRPFEPVPATPESSGAPQSSTPTQSNSPVQASAPAQPSAPPQPSVPPQPGVLPQLSVPQQPAAPPVPATPPAPPASSPRTPVATSPPAPVPFPRTPAASPSPPRVERGDALLSNNAHVVSDAVPVVGSASSRRRSALWVVLAIGVLLALMILFADRFARSSDADSPGEAPETPRAETGAPAEVPATLEAPAPPPAANPAAAASSVAAAPARSAATDSAKKPAAADSRAAANNRTAPAGATTVSLVESQLCRSLSNWRCTPATNPATPGAFVFYTRIKSARDTTVQHRWYLNGNLRRSVDLRVGANPGEGYRTYSRNTVAGERRGNWTIELRDAAGALLHEERFLVQ